MWVAKIKFNSKGAFLGPLCKKHAIAASAQQISFNVDNEGVRIYFMFFMHGAEEKKQRFLEELKNTGKIINLEQNGDHFIGQLAESAITKKMYRHNIVHTEPIKFSTDGTEIWTIAGWDKKNVLDFIEGIDTLFGAETLKIAHEKIKHVSVLTVSPEITAIQKRAMEIAIEKGYYEYPRNIELKALAKMMGISYSTYQSHLRKAERKLIPHFFERNK